MFLALFGRVAGRTGSVGVVEGHGKLLEVQSGAQKIGDLIEVLGVELSIADFGRQQGDAGRIPISEKSEGCEGPYVPGDVGEALVLQFLPQVRQFAGKSVRGEEVVKVGLPAKPAGAGAVVAASPVDLVGEGRLPHPPGGISQGVVMLECRIDVTRGKNIQLLTADTGVFQAVAHRQTVTHVEIQGGGPVIHGMTQDELIVSLSFIAQVVVRQLQPVVEPQSAPVFSVPGRCGAEGVPCPRLGRVA